MTKKQKTIAEQVYEYGEIQLPLEDVAVIFELEIEQFKKDIKSLSTEIAKSYVKGSLIGKAKLQKVIYQQATQGSSPAQKEILNIITVNKRKLIK